MSLRRSGINGLHRIQRDDRVWIGSHTLSDVRRVASHALLPCPANHAAPQATFMLTNQISAGATVAVASMHGRSPSVAALRLVDVRPRTGANRHRLLPATPNLTWGFAREEPITERRSQPVSVSREPPEDLRSHGANVR